MERRRRGQSPIEKQIVDSAHTVVEERVQEIGPDPRTITADRLIPSGITLLNCACSDNPDGAFAYGTINTIPGKSQSGKTIIMLGMLASCAVEPRFDDYDLLIDDSEETVAGFDLEYLFPPLVDRLKVPRTDGGGNPMPSETVQDFKANVLNHCNGDKPFIYVLDGLDALSSDEEMEREYQNAIKKANSKTQVEELAKGYKTEKAKHMGEALRMINGKIKRSDSALFITRQTRQNIGRGFGQREWTTSGGEAPFFYSFHSVYFASGQARYGESKNLKHKIGASTRAEVLKNKLTGKRRKAGIEFDIYEDLGVDDVASCVDFLKKTGHWKMAVNEKGQKTAYMTAPEFLGGEGKAYRADLIRQIERENGQPELRAVVGQVWNRIEDDIRLTDRARRY